MNTVNLTAIVNALLESPIQEESDDLFLSSIKGEQIDVVGAESQSVQTASVTVKWRADTEYRSWGIKSIDPIIESISGWVELIRTDVDEDITSTIDLEGWTADAKFESRSFDERTGLSLYPIAVELNLRNRTALVKF